ncbi:hypothetical protein CXB51_016125 [Gossypium anomalum]|uniref:Uncharacterized protein n=1 Tax=Gossypium anomalum TaxID=47600 RepID=A0A8J6CWC7_9ROSI|nr:hypothetical protein CXB51_015616 [Gossypium anomalum]KAG8490224.1 hypothetical protein CXB51_016125 [Gossypium anomalum]
MSGFGLLLCKIGFLESIGTFRL